ncbi:DctP family TRAP transporter solute-binding subunit [Psychrobacillus sp. NPDC096389]|uniref:DctP family TRAP transporter solute-binding subunit n=1 Tax=Psychrobacillus sp. NPDC096389 TaxID=3364490 RepID=UPI0037FDAACB
MRLYFKTALCTLVVIISYIGYQQKFWQDGSLPLDEEQSGLNEQIVIHFSHVVAEDTPKGQAAVKFAELLEEKTDGRIRVVIYPNGMLFNDDSEFDALKNNDVQMIAPTFSKVTKLLPTWQVLDLPFLFENEEDIERILTGPYGEQLLNQLNSFDVRGLGFWHNGFKQMLSTGKPLQKTEDFVGLKIRAMPSNVLQMQFKLLHATPLATSFDEIYEELEKKEIDAQENTISNIYSKGFYKLQKNLTITNHGILGYAVMINEDFFNSLPTNLQNDLIEVMDEVAEWNFEHSKQMNEDNLSRLRDFSGIHIETLSSADKEKWQKVFEPIYTYYEQEINATYLQEIKQLLNK